MPGILTYLQYLLGRIIYYIRGHDSGQIVLSRAFKAFPQANMTLEAPECGPSGSSMLAHHTCLAEDKKGGFPTLHWSVPVVGRVSEYVLICEDPDPPIPFFIINHGLFYAIPATVTTATDNDTREDQDAAGKFTLSGWRYVPNIMGSSYIGPAPPLGHGSHRYIFTIIALNKPLDFERPHKVGKKDIKRAIDGKVIGWGQWVGHFERPWPS